MGFNEITSKYSIHGMNILFSYLFVNIYEHFVFSTVRTQESGPCLVFNM